MVVAMNMVGVGEIQDAFTKAVEKASESTVSVRMASAPMGPPWGPFRRQGGGSGIVMDKDGHILTSHHVVSGADKIVVTLNDGRVLSGAVVGADDETDVAVVKVDAHDLKAADFGDSDSLKVGEPVLAIGNPLGLSGGPGVTFGIVSSLKRHVPTESGDNIQMIQTDAAVNPGNSGGPLVTLEGKVVGINAAMIPWAESIGFSVPINGALDVAKQIISHGGVKRAWVGIMGYDLNRRVANYYGLSVTRGVFVVELNSDAPAERAGIQVGDVIVSVDGKALEDVGDLRDAIRDRKIGQKAEMEVDRQGKRWVASVTLGERPT